MQLAFVVLGLAFAATGCATHTINYKNPTAQQGGATQSVKQSFFLWGLVGGTEVDLDKVCPAGVSQIQSRTGVGDQIFTVLTGGIYSPMSVDVSCAAGGAVAKGGAQ
ncbi:MAG: hypothetical protein AB7T06_08970 [Kofleriaceae bacterium]